MGAKKSEVDLAAFQRAGSAPGRGWGSASRGRPRQAACPAPPQGGDARLA